MKGEFTVMFGHSEIPGFPGFLNSREAPEAETLPASNAKLRVKFSCGPIQVDAYRASLVLDARMAIPHVVSPRGLAKILPSIVEFVSVNMVAFLKRPTPQHPEERQPMGQINFPVKPDLKVPIGFYRSSLRTFGAVSAMYQCREYSAIRVIVEKLSQAIRVDHGDKMPHVIWSVQ